VGDLKGEIKMEPLMVCPRCGAREGFEIDAETTIAVDEEGLVEDYGDMVWEDDSFTRCPECNLAGPALMFQTDVLADPCTSVDEIINELMPDTPANAVVADYLRSLPGTPDALLEALDALIASARQAKRLTAKWLVAEFVRRTGTKSRKIRRSTRSPR